MKQLTANVFVETGLKGANHGFVTTSDGIVLIDTPHKPSDAIAERRDRTARPAALYHQHRTPRRSLDRQCVFRRAGRGAAGRESANPRHRFGRARGARGVLRTRRAQAAGKLSSQCAGDHFSKRNDLARRQSHFSHDPHARAYACIKPRSSSKKRAWCSPATMFSAKCRLGSRRPIRIIGYGRSNLCALSARRRWFPGTGRCATSAISESKARLFESGSTMCAAASGAV